MRGKVTMLGKTFGFITGADGVQYFFIPSSCTGEIRFSRIQFGAAVTFEPSAHPRGPRAMDVKVQSAVEVDLPDQQEA